MLRWLAISLVAGSLFASGPARADAKHKRPNALTRIDIDKPRRLRDAPTGGRSARSRPRLTADDVIDLQRRIGPITDKQIQLLIELIRDTSPSKAMEKADLWFRLAELYAQKARYLRFRGMELHTAIDRAKPGAKRALLARQRTLLERSRQATRKAARAYRHVADDSAYIDYPRRDLVLFYYAQSLSELDDAEKARQIYQRLLTDHPDSRFVPTSFLVFADYYFESGSLANAERFYAKVIELNDPATHDYAVYRKGWVDYNLQRFQEALEAFYQVTLRTAGDAKRRTLHRAAQKDYVRAYAEIGKPRLAYRAFQRVDRARAFDMLQTLADIYLEQGKARKAVYTLRRLIQMRPRHARVCAWQRDVAETMLAAGESNRQKYDEIARLVALYAAGRERGTLRGDPLRECGQVAEELAGYMARVWHDEGVKTKNPAIMADADRMYRLYLDTFARARNFGENEYYHAELLWAWADQDGGSDGRGKRWERAANAFADVVTGGRLTGERRKESAYAAVLAWQYALAASPDAPAETPVARPDAGAPMRPRPIADRDRKMLAAFDLYIEYVRDPSDSELVGIKFLKAVTYARYHHFDRAIPIFADIVDRHPEHETAGWAALRLLDGLIMTGREDEMIRWVRALSERDALLARQPTLREQVVTLHRTWLRKQAEKLEAGARRTGSYAMYIDCGKTYLAIYNDDPQAADADEVLYDAAVCFEQGRSLGAALTIYDQLGELHPRSPHAHKALARQGAAYARAGFYGQAAARLEEYVRRFGGQQDAPDALSEAVFYYAGIGASDDALRASELFIRRYGKRDPERAAEAMFRIASIHEERGDHDRAIATLRRYLRSHGKRDALHRRIAAHARLGQMLWSASCPVTGVDGACIRMTRGRNVSRRRARRAVEMRKRCGDDSRIRLRVVERDRRRVRDAQTEFRKVIDLYRRAGKASPTDAGRAALMKRHAASASFYLAEEQYEDYLTIALPAGLDFDPSDPAELARSQKRFARWFEDKLAQGVRTEKAYRRAVIGDPTHAISSAARVGQVSQNFADALFSAEIPRHLRRGRHARERVDAYCDALAERAEPLEKNSIQAFKACLDTSTRLGWFSDWSRLCERELGQIDPASYPTATELRSAPRYLAAIRTVEPIAVLPEPDDERPTAAVGGKPR